MHNIYNMYTMYIHTVPTIIFMYIYIYKIKQKIDFFFLITRKMHHVWTTYNSNKLTGLELLRLQTGTLQSREMVQ